MKLKNQLIFASFLLLSAGVLFSACSGEDWYAEDDILTDASHGSLTNKHIVATGDVKNITCNSATILFSTNYNYKESLGIKPGILYSDHVPNDYFSLDFNSNQYNSLKPEHIEIGTFSNSECELTINNLKPFTKYYYRAYAEANGRKHYGDVKSFITTAKYTPGEAVDLGLSVKWADRNIGASEPGDDGLGFFWGGIEPCTVEDDAAADWHSYSLSTLKSQGFIDNNDNLCPTNDAATQIWGSQWRIPTNAECEELIAKCTWKETTKSGRKVYLITGPNSNFIYLPMNESGYIDDYWSATASSEGAYHLSMSYSSGRCYYGVKIWNRSWVNKIRPVKQ